MVESKTGTTDFVGEVSMGVYIKGMEMPEGCPFCPLSHWTRATNEFAGCDIVQSKRYAMLNDIEFAASLAKSRPDWCPLADVPTPHGRLIDEYVLIGNAFNGEQNLYCWDDIEKAIDSTPTIIEAEENNDQINNS